jgi:arginine N-succinyltransferase
VGPGTKTVEKMLIEAGFRYAQRIDPFDGGPHFHARTDEVLPVQRSLRATVRAITPLPQGSGAALVASTRPAPPYFLALRSPALLDPAELPGPRGVRLPPATASALGLSVGDELGLLPL